MFPFSGEGRETSDSMGPNRVGICWVPHNHWPKRVCVSVPSPEDVNRSSFRNIEFFNYLEFRTMDKVQKPSDSECYAPSSEPFKIYLESYSKQKLLSN
jgi:hypothetical protein